MSNESYQREKKGRFTFKEIPLPAHLQLEKVIRSNGSTWKVVAESVGMDYRTLRKYVGDYPDTNEFLER